MKTGKRFWSLVLALIMVVSLMGGALVVNAEDEVMITPTATYGGATLTMTATGLVENYTFFDLATIGYGTAKQYAFWFETGGSFSFDQDVAISFQGAPKADLKAGEVYSAANFSECYVTLDDGNMLVIIDQNKPGNYASLSPDKSFSEFPGTIGTVTAEADEPAEEPAAEEPAAEEPAAEEPAAEEPAAEGEGFVKTDALEVGKQYVFVAEYDGKYYALAYDGAVSAVEVTVAGDAVVPESAGLVWTLKDGNQAQSVAVSGTFLYPYASGMTYGGLGRSLIYENEKLYFITSDGTPGYVKFDGAAFGYVKGDEAAAAKILLFTGEAAVEEKEPEPKKDYPEPETVRRAAVKNEDGSITLAFTSDIHYDGKNMNLAKWLEVAEADYGYIDAFGFCGDIGSAYATGPEDFWTWGGEVMDYMDAQIAAGKVGDAIYTQGNHEWFPSAGGDYDNVYTDYACATRYMQVGEGLVTDDYIIYCFGAGIIAKTYVYDYDEEDIAALDEYLASAPTDIPIFILTHFPVHLWESRKVDHAADLIDVLNKYPNVVVLWGHNHSNYDEFYYQPQFPGDEIVIDDAGTVRQLNFTYLSAGCTSDADYTGPDGGSASVMNKGLVVTINADGTLSYKYYTLDGEVMPIEGPWLVRFRTGYGDPYEVCNTQYVEDGQSPAAVEAPELEGYTFKGWFIRVNGVEVEFDFNAPITENTLVTARYAKILTPAAAPNAADCITVTPDATFNGAPLTVTCAGVGDLITAFDLASIGYGTAVMYGFWFEPGGVISFSQDVTLLYQGATTDFTLKAGEFYSTEGFGEHYIQLDDGKSDFLILEYENPGNYKSYPGDKPYSAFPGTIVVGGGAAEPEPAPVEPEPAPVEPEPAPAPAPAEGGKTYTVKEGDSLRSISKEFYGTIHKWRLIYEANFDSMKGTDMIYVGQVLQIP